MKHAEIARCATDILSSIQKVTEALRDGDISDEEYNRISDEIDLYRQAKEDVRAKAISTGRDDETMRKKWLQEGRKAMRKQLAERLDSK